METKANWLTLEEFKAKGFDHTWCWIYYDGGIELSEYCYGKFINDDGFPSNNSYITHVMPIPQPEAP